MISSYGIELKKSNRESQKGKSAIKMDYDLYLTEIAKEENMNISDFLNLDYYWANLIIGKHKQKAKYQK